MTSSHPGPGEAPPPPRPRHPGIPQTDPLPSARELGAELVRELGQGLLEIGTWTVAVLVVVGGLGVLGHLVAGGLGTVVGVVAGVVVLGVAWLVLVVRGVAVAGRSLRRGRAR